MAGATAARYCRAGHPPWIPVGSAGVGVNPLGDACTQGVQPHSKRTPLLFPEPPLLKPHPLLSSLEGEKGLEIKSTLLWGEKNRRAFGRADGHRFPRAAAGCLPALALPLQPVCLSHGCRELPGAGRAVRKTGRRTGGLRAGNREHGSSWETLRRPGQERPLCWGRAAAGAGGGGAGAAAPLVLRIPGGNGIFGGSRAPGRNSRAAFGARLWPSHWDLALLSWHRGVGFRQDGCCFWAREGMAVTCKYAKLWAGCWGPLCGSSSGLEHRVCLSSDTGAGCAPGEPSLGTSCLSFPHCRVASFQVLAGSAARWVCQQLRAAPCLRCAGSGISRASRTAVRGGKSSHVRSMTCLQVISR